MAHQHESPVIIKKREIVWLGILLVIVSVLMLGIGGRSPIASSETRFVEQSANGMHIVPASCPSAPAYAGECSGGEGGCPTGYRFDGARCVATNVCNLSPVCADQTHVLNQCTGATTDCTTAYGKGWYCGAGQCLTPPPPSLAIRATPSILHPAETSTITWSSTNSDSCIVSGSNGDGGAAAWGNDPSGSHATIGIVIQTTYSITCLGYDGSQISKSVTINIIPRFIEK